MQNFQKYKLKSPTPAPSIRLSTLYSFTWSRFRKTRKFAIFYIFQYYAPDPLKNIRHLCCRQPYCITIKHHIYFGALSPVVYPISTEGYSIFSAYI